MHRRTTSQRGYGRTHQTAREGLRVTLPRLCAYGCGTMLTADGVWVAAHVIDGDPSAGYVASCVTCNERHKGGRPVEKLHRGGTLLTRAPIRRACQSGRRKAPGL